MWMTNDHRSIDRRTRRSLSAVAMLALAATLPLVAPLVPAAVAGPPDSVSLVADVKAGATGSDPTGLLDMGGTLYFAATQGDRELWKYDGSGHSLVRDINAGAGSSDPRELTKRSASVFFFSATGFGGRELWRSNGTASGTAQVGEVNAGSASSTPTELTMVGSTLFFSAFDGTDRELWKSDGTLAGTVQVKDIAPGAGSGDPQDLTQVGGTLFFTAADAGASSRELWKSDGTAAGTVRVKDINPGTTGSLPLRLTAVGSTLFFSAMSGTGSHELWKSDGTSAGTVRVAQNALLRAPVELTNVGGTLFFSATTTAQGRELWKSNGTTAGTVQVADIILGDQSGEPTELAAVGGRLFFQAGAETNRELWTSNGTAAGTVRVKEINVAGSSSPAELTEIAGTAYFAATDSTHGRELWRSDGTAGGTVRVGDVATGAASSSPTYLTASGGQLFLSADDGASVGREVWRTMDSIAPNTSITSGPAEGSTTSDTPITLGFASDDLPSTFRCRFTLTAPGQQPGTPPAFGSCSSANSHTLTPVPASGTLVTFEVRATDAAGNVDPTPASRTFTVVAPDAPPVAVNDELTVLREIGLPAALDVLANDTDADGGSIRIESVTQPTNGSVEIVDGGASLSYEPSRQYCNDSGPFTYTLNGGSTATVRVTVLCGDSPPVAQDDDISVVRETGPSLLDVLANDKNPDGGPILIESVGHPRHGSVEIVDSGSRLSYEPDRDVCTDSGSFTYTLNGGSTATVMVRVSCTPVDRAPVAVGDSATVLQDAEATGIDVLVNDTDADGGPMVVESVTQPFNGAAAITGSGSGLTYTPNRGYCNDTVGAPSDRPGPPDTFTYMLNGGSVATVSLRVTCTPEPVDLLPVAVDDAATVAQDAEATEIDVLANDTDADGGPMVVESVTQPTNGTVAVSGSGSGLTYAPDSGYCNDAGAPDRFTYALNGGSTGTAEMAVTCVPEVVDQNPAAVDDAAIVVQDVTAKQINVLDNDTDADGGPMVVESVTQSTNGAVAITGSGSALTYTPNRGYCNDAEAPDTFTYTLNGGSTATVTVKVICGTLTVDKAPVAVDDAATIPQDAEATQIGVLANDTDADGGLMLVESVTQPAHGVVAITGSGSGLSYAPIVGYCSDVEAPDTFTYTLNRGSVATVAVTVTCEPEPEPVDLAPVAVDDASTVAQDAEATEIDVLANDTDADGGPMVVESVTQPAHGVVAITGSGSGLSYAPRAGYCEDAEAPDTFTYTLNGGSTATVDMSVTCDEEAPPPADTTAPQTEITGTTNLLGLSLWLSQKGTFTFTSTELGSTFECRVDQAAFEPCTSPHAVTIPFGTHTFAVRAIDPAGNVDPTPATSSVLVAGLF
ncbi:MULTISPECIES: ELWxxDGT repeat protein [unclassified Nocardioides]|uniref:ELWxxDGT repeat protein n=1 Tax=unclassified Nocardioides TaxID=2615069 RepID=UPI000701C976|nr:MULTISPECIES: ELWxxDGT repeat protein [unclassified Nocardioides]KRA31023.1 hypothetical protein ASD81_16125 [Nocardioides sp. Root614]KRA87644.1 hypothetical protein ASD84_16400 [Nocardioides sp. Root682]